MQKRYGVTEDMYWFIMKLLNPPVFILYPLTAVTYNRIHFQTVACVKSVIRKADCHEGPHLIICGGIYIRIHTSIP